jgi:hypothetical protein
MYLTPLLTVLTTKIRPSKPRVEYTTSFMHIFYTNKVPQVVLQFLWTGTHLGGEMEPTCHTSQARLHHQARLHLPSATSPVPIKSFPVCTTWMNEIDQGNVSLIEWMKL